MSTINIQEIIIVNGLGVFLMVVLLMMRFKDIHKISFKEKLYNVLIWLTILCIVSETISFLIDNRMFSGSIILSYASNTVSILSAVGIGFVWCIYVDLHVFNSFHRIRRSVKYLGIPILYTVICCIINLTACGVLFSISNENVYQRGILLWLQYIFVFGYIFYSIIIVLHSKKSGLNINFFPIYYFVVPCMIGIIIQGVMYGIALGMTSVAVALFLVYVQIQSSNAMLDSLSGLYNRRYLDNLLEHLQHNAKNPVYGIMIDVNGFKTINDNYGHSAGDSAIRSIGHILSDSIPKCGIATRFAGDEFMILLNTGSEAVVKETIKQIEINIDKFNASKKHKYQLSLSMGYECLDAKIGNVEAFLCAMDNKMYAEKKKYYDSYKTKP